jgi:hypothetical protein
MFKGKVSVGSTWKHNIKLINATNFYKMYGTCNSINDWIVGYLKTLSGLQRSCKDKQDFTMIKNNNR